MQLKYQKVVGPCEALCSEDIVIYGTGMGAVNRYIELLPHLKRFHNSVLGFVDSCSSGCEKDIFCGKKIFSIQEVCDIEKKINLYISTYVQQYIYEILELLEENKFEGKIYVLRDPWKWYPCDPKTDAIKLKVKNSRELFTDDLSKKVYDAVCKYRECGDLTDLSKAADSEAKQYFPDFINWMDEIFVDCGAYYGDTTLNVLEKEGKNCKRIYAFEPDVDIFSIFQTIKKIRKLDKVTIFPYGVYSQTTNLKFQNAGDSTSNISVNGNAEIKVVAMDDFLWDLKEKITYVKMDIEGVEQSALKGMENIIRRDAPKLAICVYHKEEDLWQIPQMILDMQPKYKLYLRHYSKSTAWETVCYAVTE